MFEEAGGNDKKKKWIMIGIGTGIIAIFLLIRNSMNNAAAQPTTAAPEPVTSIADQGSYPGDFTGGISGTGMDQTLATYLAIADQNTNVQMEALNKTMTSVQDQNKTMNQALQDQITAMNSKQTTAAMSSNPQPVTTSTPAITSHPAPTTITHVVTKGETLSGIASKQYGKQPAYATGIKQVAALNKISNPNKISVGQKILLPAKLS
jgi:nucleoid-associated protein YgaU